MQSITATTIFTLLCGSVTPYSRCAWFLLICGLPYSLQFLKFSISSCLKLTKFPFCPFNSNPSTKKTIMFICTKNTVCTAFSGNEGPTLSHAIAKPKSSKMFCLLEHNFNFQETRFIYCSETTLLVESVFIWPNKNLK